MTSADADTGELVESALTEARDRLWRESGGDADISWIDALRDVCQRSLAFDGTKSRSDRYRSHLHLDTTATATDTLGWRLPDAIRRFITCDGVISPTFTDGAIPISVGRAQHIVPLRTRLEVLRRDGGCRVPGCRATHGLEVHHIIHWEDHGPTDTWNLIAICPRHHRLHHRGRLGISGNADDPDGVEFRNANGRPIPATGARPIPPAGPPPPPTGTWSHPLGERLDSRWLTIALEPTVRRRNQAA